MSITLTERAATHVKRFLAGKADILRLGVRKTGCSGYAYVVEPATAVEADDLVFESHGIRMVVDSGSLDFLDGMEVDYAREGLNESFRFNNPNVKAICGCGESFSA